MAHDLVLHGARLLTGDGPVPSVDPVETDGWVAVADGRIAALGHGVPPEATERVDVAGDWLAPGYVDVHVHGGSGGDAMASDRDARLAVRRLHARHGTTAMLASTVSRPVAELRDAVTRLADDVEAAEHRVPWRAWSASTSKGPSSPAYAGAPTRRRRSARPTPPRPTPCSRPVAATSARSRSPPSFPVGSTSSPGWWPDGVTVAVGHTDADAATVRAAVDAGARAVTHTFNGMQPLHHRRPGPVGMAMDLPQLTCELILDLVHVDPVAARALVHAAGADRICLITDAMAATGMSDGTYELGGQTVEVVDGQVRVEGHHHPGRQHLDHGDRGRERRRPPRDRRAHRRGDGDHDPRGVAPGVSTSAGSTATGPPTWSGSTTPRSLRGVWISGKPVDTVDSSPKEVTVG